VGKQKEISCEISDPVLLNCWKHHAGFIKSKISEYRESENFNYINFREELLHIGDSLMDLYLGDFTPNEIALTIINLFKKKNILEKNNFIIWLKNGGKDFRVIKLKDKSLWTIRLGEQKNKYIHIHPSRYSPQTIRVRALTLKSAILYLILNKSEADIADNLLFLNRIRKEYLDQPPLKMISIKSTLPRLISILKD
jgi:hypothetical protein